MDFDRTKQRSDGPAIPKRNNSKIASRTLSVFSAVEVPLHSGTRTWWASMSTMPTASMHCIASPAAHFWNDSSSTTMSATSVVTCRTMGSSALPIAISTKSSDVAGRTERPVLTMAFFFLSSRSSVVPFLTSERQDHTASSLSRRVVDDDDDDNILYCSMSLISRSHEILSLSSARQSLRVRSVSTSGVVSPSWRTFMCVVRTVLARRMENVKPPPACSPCWSSSSRSTRSDATSTTSPLAMMHTTSTGMSLFMSSSHSISPRSASRSVFWSSEYLKRTSAVSLEPITLQATFTTCTLAALRSRTCSWAFASREAMTSRSTRSVVISTSPSSVRANMSYLPSPDKSSASRHSILSLSRITSSVLG
eukprot:PhM_4_TR18089/c0_g1_i1/m.106269